MDNSEVVVDYKCVYQSKYEDDIGNKGQIVFEDTLDSDGQSGILVLVEETDLENLGMYEAAIILNKEDVVELVDSLHIWLLDH